MPKTTAVSVHDTYQQCASLLSGVLVAGNCPFPCGTTRRLSVTDA